MAYNMKRGNKKRSYSETFNDSFQAITDAEENKRKASIEEEKIETPLDKKAPTKMWGKIIETAIGALKEDTAALERANNRNVSAMSIQRK